jgi:hypothetical protein
MRGPIPGLVVSTMQSLNGDREPGHRRCRRRGRMMRGDAAEVTGAVPAVSLAATPFQLFAHRPLPVSHALGCRGHGLQAPSPPWGASTPNCLTVRRCRRMWVRGGRIWCMTDPWPGVGGAWSGMWRAVVGGAVVWPAPTQAPRAPPRNCYRTAWRGDRTLAARPRETRRGGAQGRTAGAQQGSAARWRGREARPGGAAERSEEDGGGRPAEPAVAAETPRSSRPTELEHRRGRPWSSCS